MPQSLSAVYLHLVFSTKDRRPFLQDAALRMEMHAYLAATSAQLNCPAIIVGGVEDHVHLLARLGRTITQAEWVKELKRVSSTWVKTRDMRQNEFAWQAGYGVFSVSTSNVEATREYVATQEERHRQWTFQDEFRSLMRKHGIEWDERHVWD